MKITKKRTGCYCSNCDMEEGLYTITSETGTSFKLNWACGKTDSEITFCQDCAEKLFRQLAIALSEE